MKPFELIAVLVVLAAGLSYLNLRLLKLPSTIGLMALTLLLSMLVLIIGTFVPAVKEQARAVVSQIDFEETLLHGMLGFLLFAGALHVDLGDLARSKWPIAILATAGVFISTAFVGGLVWVFLRLLGHPVPIVGALLFGALISPTDPIAVLGLLKHLGVPKSLQVQFAGESLFNDGVGVVLFLGLLEGATSGQGLDAAGLVALFLREAIGGALFGFGAGVLVYYLLKAVDHYQVEIMLSLALVAGGFALADALHLSAPIAMVVAGLIIGNHGRLSAMSPSTKEHLDMFWELIDEILNALLFVLIGMELLVLTFTARYLVAGLMAVPTVLLARFISVALPVRLLARREPLNPAAVPILTWGGLRGGISVALALSLPRDGVVGRGGDVLIAMTYVVVVFSILVQGLTIAPLARHWLSATSATSTE